MEDEDDKVTPLNLEAELKAFKADLTERLNQLKAGKLIDAKAFDDAISRLDKVTADHEGFKQRLSKIESRSNRGGLGIGSPDGEKASSLGAAFTSSEAYKGAVKGKSYRTDRVRIPGAAKAATTAAGYGGDAANPFRREGMVEIPTRTLRVMDLFPRMSSPNGSIEFVRETAFYNIHAPLTSQAASGQKNLVVENSRGFVAGSTVLIAPGTGPAETRIIDTINHDTNTITVTVNLANTHAAGVEVVSDQFVFTPETKLKPLAELRTELVTATAKTIAVGLKISRQLAHDAPALEQYINQRLPVAVALQFERQLLYGNGASDQLDGVLTNASILTYSWSNGSVGDTKADALRRAMTLATLSFYEVDNIVLHPDDLEDIELAKATDGHYLLMHAAAGMAQPNLWRVPVVTTPVINSGTGLLGSFSQAGIIWEVEDLEVAMYDQHSDWALRNMILILAEMRAAFAFERPTSMVKVTFDSAPAE